MISEDRKYNKNILVITTSPWTETNAFGNTISNFFAGWEHVNFHNVYCREELPQNDICTDYFNITEKQLIKNIFTPSKNGQEYSIIDVKKLRQEQSYKKNAQKEKRLLHFFGNRRWPIFLFAREIIWKIGRWKNKRLDEFLDKNAIDIVFAAAADPIYLQNIVLYCTKKTNAKLVLFFADDIYSFKSINPIEMLYQIWLRATIESSAINSDKLYGASNKLCEEYEKHFSKRIEPLYKGCNLSENDVKNNVGTPIKIVYAGNLYYGRWQTLKVLANEIAKINKSKNAINLEIYTNTIITNEIEKALNISGASKIMAALEYEEIKKVLARADIVLHVEAFDPRQIKITRLSFSTKIIDCMQSGSCLLAIGPEDVASIDYLRKIEGPIVILHINEIALILKETLQI